MKPIISPLFIYLASIISTLKIVVTFIIVLAGVAIVIEEDFYL